MSNNSLIIEERSRDIGDFLVGRLLPFRKKRMVGPFVFVDHMGPSLISGDKPFEVDQHPHIGLATLTYLLEGAVMHRDSLGTVQKIQPGEVNLMVAGIGVTHTERTPEALKGKSFQINGYQIWIALPANKEEMEPEFHHLGANEIPEWEALGAQFRLITGEAFGHRSPLPTFSPQFMVEVICPNPTDLDLAGQFQGEIGIIVSKGAVEACGEVVQAGNMLVSKEEDQCRLQVHPGSHLFLIGGEPFPEKRFIDWNFVSSRREAIDQAKADWIQRKFPQVPGDETYVPYPTIRG